jgi:ATP-dependent DNA helicase RecQ
MQMLKLQTKNSSYFGELVTENCGNCDICKNPPTFLMERFRAKALSAITRLQESESLL